MVVSLSSLNFLQTGPQACSSRNDWIPGTPWSPTPESLWMHMVMRNNSKGESSNPYPVAVCVMMSNKMSPSTPGESCALVPEQGK